MRDLKYLLTIRQSIQDLQRVGWKMSVINAKKTDNCDKTVKVVGIITHDYVTSFALTPDEAEAIQVDSLIDSQCDCCD